MRLDAAKTWKRSVAEHLGARRMLLRRGWQEEGVLDPLRKGDAAWGVKNASGDSSLSAPRRGGDGRVTICFPGDTPARIIACACEAAAGS